ncbi:MAG: type III pantothenate kinase [Fibrobacteraceae bacterium]|nr:type III pantothenate kinase [Fibrobacteraceae bacterium]
MSKTASCTLAVDVGNTHTVVGLFKGEKVVDHWRLTTRNETTSDEVLNRVAGLLRFSKVKQKDITHIGLSTVVPSHERPWIKALEFLIPIPVQVVTDKNCLGLKIAYPNPEAAGADRLCNILALRERGLKDAIVVDMGTATTFDVMKEGGFVGGLIIPGISASLDALTEKTAKLVPVTIEWPKKIVADNPDDAIRAGLLFGFCAELETLIKKIKKEMHWKEVPVFATGGWGKTIAKRTPCIDTYDPYLTLEGIRHVAERGTDASFYEEEEEDEV